MSLITAFLAALFLVGLNLAIQLKCRAWRRQRLKGLELRPNCLLTRHPIAFLSGRRSLFRLFSHWNDIPLYLREHGYEVLIIEPVSGAERKASWASVLDALPEKCHLIGDSSVEDDLSEAARSKHPNVATITLVRNGARENRMKSGRRSSLSVADLRPLESAIEVFDVADAKANLHLTHALNYPQLALVWLHNALGVSRKAPVDPIETGDLISNDGWSLEARFLDLAISLAERDAQWSD